MLKKLYMSPFGYLISLIQNLISIVHKPFMVYGFYNNVQKRFFKYTRISSNTKVLEKNKLDLDDYVWIGHYSLLDASNNIEINKGVQTGSHISIFTHSSHNSIRLLGEAYISLNSRIGYVSGAVKIGEFTFIGSYSIIFPGVTIGKGSLIKAGTIVTSSFPDYSIIAGNPACKVGSTIDLDKKYFDNEIVKENYYCKELIDYT